MSYMKLNARVVDAKDLNGAIQALFLQEAEPGSVFRFSTTHIMERFEKRLPELTEVTVDLLLKHLSNAARDCWVGSTSAWWTMHLTLMLIRRKYEFSPKEGKHVEYPGQRATDKDHPATVAG